MTENPSLASKPRDSLQSKIIASIEKSGFPLELRISNSLLERGYFVGNGLYYLDEDEGKGREIDIRALKNEKTGKFNLPSGSLVETMVRNCLLIECKKSDQPWVFFTSNQNSYDKELVQLDCLGFDKGYFWHADAKLYKYISAVHPFAFSSMRGRSHFEPFKSGEGTETIFKATTTAVKATLFTMKSKFAAGMGSACFYYPIVIYDGNLFEAFLMKNKINLKKTELVFLSYFYTSQIYGAQSFIVSVLTEKGFRNSLILWIWS